MEEGEHEDDDEEMDEDIIEINGVKYAPITEDDIEEGGDKPRREDDDEEMDEDIDNLDLRSRNQRA